MNKLQSLTLIALLGLMCSLRLTGSDYTSKMMTAQSQEQIQSKGKTIGKIEQVQSQEQVQSKSYSKPEKITQSQEQVQSKVSKGAKGGKVIQSQEQAQIQSNSVKGGKTNGKFTNDDDIYDDVTFEDDDATLITDTKNSNKKSFLK